MVTEDAMPKMIENEFETAMMNEIASGVGVILAVLPPVLIAVVAIRTNAVFCLLNQNPRARRDFDNCGHQPYFTS